MSIQNTGGRWMLNVQQMYLDILSGDWWNGFTERGWFPYLGHGRRDCGSRLQADTSSAPRGWYRSTFSSIIPSSQGPLHRSDPENPSLLAPYFIIQKSMATSKKVRIEWMNHCIEIWMCIWSVRDIAIYIKELKNWIYVNLGGYRVAVKWINW